MTQFARSCQRGFSFIEMIAVIVVMAIMAVGLVQFIVDSSEGYVLTAARNQVSSAGRVVIDRIAMELHNALPESVRIWPEDPQDSDTVAAYAGDQCLEFIPVIAATTYIDPAIRPAAHKMMFEAVEFLPEQDDVTDVYAVIYPTSAADIYAASFAGPNTEAAIAAVDVIEDADDPDGIGGVVGADGINEITTLTNHRFQRASSAQRIFLTGEPVSYCVTGSKMYRYSSYGFHATQLVPEMPGGGCVAADCLPAATNDMGGVRVLITDQLDNGALTGGVNSQAFDNFEASRNRNAVIQLDLNFTQDGQEVRLNHEIMQQSTP